tara:strand:- start:153 stop:650 length:498 start_codon:yes stop_codon:yes gene_type:complete
MKIYHYTNVINLHGIQHKGLKTISSNDRQMWHPVSQDFKNAVWAFDEAIPQKWIKNTSSTIYNLTCLFGHCAGGDTLTLLEIDLPDDTELWATDWTYACADVRASDGPNYYKSIVPYTGKDCLNGFKLPEIICFDDISPEYIKQISIPNEVRPHVRPIDLMTPPY